MILLLFEPKIPNQMAVVIRLPHTDNQIENFRRSGFIYLSNIIPCVQSE